MGSASSLSILFQFDLLTFKAATPIEWAGDDKASLARSLARSALLLLLHLRAAEVIVGGVVGVMLEKRK